MNEPNVVILAGGISSRMKRSAQGAKDIERALVHDASERSKSMIGVGEGRRPFLDYVLYTLGQSGYSDVVLLLGEKDASIREYYGGKEQRKAFKNLRLTFVVQPIPSGRQKPLGTADALQRALEAKQGWSHQQVTVCNSDNLYSIEALKLLLDSRERNSLISYDFPALRFPPERIRQFAILTTDAQGFLQDIIEKPTDSQIALAGKNTGVSMNLFRFAYEDILPYLSKVELHPERNEKELPEAVRLMVKDLPRSMKVYRRSEYVPDLTTVQDIPEVQKHLHENFSHVQF